MEETERVLLIGGKMNMFWLELSKVHPVINVPVLGRTLQSNEYCEDEELETYYLRGYIQQGGTDQLAIYGIHKMSVLDVERRLIENYSNPLLHKD